MYPILMTLQFTSVHIQHFPLLTNYMLTNTTINAIISMPPKCNPSVMYASPSDLHDPKMIWVPKWFRRPSLKQAYPYLSKITFCSSHPENLNKYKYNKSLNLKRQRSVIKYVPLCSNIHNQQWSGTSNSFLLMNQQYNLLRSVHEPHSHPLIVNHKPSMSQVNNSLNCTLSKSKSKSLHYVLRAGLE